MRAYLQRPNIESDSIWFFDLQIQRDLLGRWQVIREWGRLDSPGTLRSAPFDTMEEAVESFQIVRDQLIKKGYRVVMQQGLRSGMATRDLQEQELDRGFDS